jgi:hypothetical protein
MSSLKPFTISIPESKLQRLQQKLDLTDYPNEIIDTTSPWSRGAPLAETKRLAQYWANGFSWRKAEAELNKFPQYITEIDVHDFGTYDVHFVHQPSSVANAIPLLFIHGWPGSFIEATKMLPLLVEGGEFPAFHVVAPSLIDFGFSSGSGKVSIYSE